MYLIRKFGLGFFSDTRMYKINRLSFGHCSFAEFVAYCICQKNLTVETIQEPENNIAG